MNFDKTVRIELFAICFSLLCHVKKKGFASFFGGGLEMLAKT